MSTRLDYEFIEGDDGKWEVWTPDGTGAVIGSGKTIGEALADAVANMEATCAEFKHEIRMMP